MSKSNMAVAEAYYRAMENKDLAGMGRYLHPKVHFIGPLAEITGKESVLEAVQRLLPLIHKVTIRAKFNSEDQVMLAYDLKCSAPIGVLRIAALLTFKEGLIIRLELFFDARPFDK